MSLPAKILNVTGLLFGVIGAGLIWKYGLPPSVDRQGHQHLITEQVNQDEIDKARRFDKRSGIGFALLILGFILQAISDFI